jgi:hypothetical protein
MKKVSIPDDDDGGGAGEGATAMGTLMVSQKRYDGGSLLFIQMVSRSQGNNALIRLYTPGTNHIRQGARF